MNEHGGGSNPKKYGLPQGATDLQDLIEYRDMNFAVGNMFKALYRMGQCNHSTRKRDLEKIIWFANRELSRPEGVDSHEHCADPALNLAETQHRSADHMFRAGVTEFHALQEDASKHLGPSYPWWHIPSIPKGYKYAGFREPCSGEMYLTPDNYLTQKWVRWTNDLPAEFKAFVLKAGAPNAQ